jgi:hypothetical protein
VASLFAAFLGYNPVQKLLGPALLHHLPAASVAALTGRSFFPRLMTPPFSSALSTAFTFSFLACLVAAGASWLRGGKYHYREEPEEPAAVVTPDEPGPVTPAGPASGAVSGAASGPGSSGVTPSGAASGAVSGAASGPPSGATSGAVSGTASGEPSGAASGTPAQGPARVPEGRR